MTSLQVSKPTFEHHPSGLGVGHSQPRISWKILPSENHVSDWVQTSYEIEITTLPNNHPEVFTFKSEQNVLVPWPAQRLSSRQLANIRVRSCGRSGTQKEQWTSWSETARVEAALLEKTDWKASFISSAQRIGPDGPLQPLRFRKEFQLTESKLSKARLYITALGVFDAYINGKPVSEDCLAPGWTSYKHRLNYCIYDVTSLLSVGTNVLCVEAAEGWYAGRLGFKGGKRFCYDGQEIAILAQLEIDADGEEGRTQIVSDESWTCSPSAIKTSELYDGEVYDMQHEVKGWNTANFKDPQHVSTKAIPWPPAKLVAPDAPPVRITETLPAQRIFKSKSGKTIIDFGQNLVGKLLIKSVQLPKGCSLTFKHAEVMEHEELGVRPLRGAKATDIIISSGEQLENWTPRFTFHGFRYVQVEGWPSESGMPSQDDVVALVMHSNMKRRGYFHCSNSSVNQLHKNVVWSMKGNFLSIPTDCPQRDERLGWTGDLQVFCPSATYLYGTEGMLGNWLEDVAVEQLEDWRKGIPPLVVPDVIPPNWPHIPQAVWDDVTVLAPNVLYEYSGDKDILERQFRSMQAWIDQGVDRGEDGLWNSDRWQLSDWLDPSAPPEDPGAARTDNVMVADAYLVHVTGVLSNICSVLGKTAEASRYKSDKDKLKSLFQHKYITAYGNLMSNSQTGLALAMQFDLYRSASELAVAARSLSKLVRTARFNIATGFAGTPVILHALTKTNLPQLAYRMLLEKSCPSWIYPITMGATTIWERWNSMLPDGTINPGQMTSFNHYALGAVVDWLHSSVGGISPLEPGWKVIKVRPVPGGNVTSAEVKFDGPYGEVSCEWKLVGEEFSMTLIVPPNSTALVTLPSEWQDGGEEPRKRVGSGKYDFHCVFHAAEWPPKALVASNQPMPVVDIAE